MRVRPGSRPIPPMLIDALVPDQNFLNIHVGEARAPADKVWASAARLVADLVPRAGGRSLRISDVPLAAAAIMRGDLGRRAKTVWSFREGERIGSDHAWVRIERIDEGREIVLTGAHRYASFAANLFLEPIDERRTRLWNVTRARFSTTLPGRVYRRGVDVFHDLYIRRTLRIIMEGAEAG